MINIYHSIVSYQKDDFKEHLNRIGVLDIFNPLSKEFEGKIFNGVVRFILYGYSVESEILHSTGISWIVMAKIIYEKCELPNDDEYFQKIANLKSESVKDVIEKWLSAQNSESFVEYTNARDLRRYCLQQSQTADKTKERVDAMKYAKECQAMMEDAKSRFVENYDHLKPSLNALKKEKQKNTLGPQDYAT